MKLFDLHCDTPYELYKRKLTLFSGETAFDLGKCGAFSEVTQVMAFWSNPERSSDECYEDFFKMFENLSNEAEKARLEGKSEGISFIPAVEGARLIGKDLGRVGVLASYGVKILTPIWKGIEAAGGGYDTDEGLTDFGKALVKECEKVGIIVDTSHMSEKSFWDTVNISEKPIMASHSNSSGICNHPRNITDIQFRTIAESGGVVGVTAAAKFVSAKYANDLPTDGKLFVSEFCDHIEHYLNLDGAEHVCLGCDFDGTEPSPGLSDVSCMESVREELLSRNIREDVVDGVIFENAKKFFAKCKALN